jgi:hypothetical protein
MMVWIAFEAVCEACPQTRMHFLRKKWDTGVYEEASCSACHARRPMTAEQLEEVYHRVAHELLPEIAMALVAKGNPVTD